MRPSAFRRLSDRDCADETQVAERSTSIHPKLTSLPSPVAIIDVPMGEAPTGDHHINGHHEFKRWVGVAPMAYTNQRRAERAAVLLSGTDDSIGAIGRAVGWPEPSSFSRHFGKAFGVSPREYRRRRNQREGT